MTRTGHGSIITENGVPVERLPGFSAIGGRLDGKVISVTMFAGRLFAATANGVFMLNEQGEWAALELKP